MNDREPVREIRKNGLIFRIAYLFTPENLRPADTVNLCTLARRVVFNLIVATVTGCAAAVATGAVLYFAVVHLPPVLWGLCVRAFNAIASVRAADVGDAFMQPVVLMLITAVVLMTIIFSAMVLIPILRARAKQWVEKHETARLILDYIRAKKEKICPIYKIKSDDP